IDLFVSVDGDDVGRKIGQMRLANDVVGCRKVSTDIESGNKLWELFAIRSLGQMIENGGDEISFSVPADKLPEIPQIASQYCDLVHATCTVGVGRNLAESSKALLVGKLRGKHQMVIFQDEMNSEIDEAMKNLPSEAVKLHEAYLAHEDSDILGKSADPADIQKRLQPFVPKSTPPVSLPPVKQPDVPQDAPINHEEEFHNIAQAQGAKDLQGQQHSKETLEQIKEGVTETLQNLRLQLPAIAQLQQTSP